MVYTKLKTHKSGREDLAAPVSTTDGGDRDLGVSEGSLDGDGHLTGALDSEAEMTVVVTNGNDGLEAGALTGAGLLLYWGDLEHLILQLGATSHKF